MKTAPSVSLRYTYAWLLRNLLRNAPTLLAAMAANLSAAPVRISFSGVWRLGLDLTNGPVQPGDAFYGTVSYDPERTVVSSHTVGLTGGDHPILISQWRCPASNSSFSPTRAPLFSGVTALQMSALVVNDFFDGTYPAYDRFVIQSFPTAHFPGLYARSVERLDLDIFDLSLSTLQTGTLPTNLELPSAGGYAFVGIQGGSSNSDLDFNAGGTINVFGPAINPGSINK